MLNFKNTKTANKRLDFKGIAQYYQSAAKKESDFKLGLEYEKISLNSTSYESADYNYLEKIIKNFAHIKNWGILYDDKAIIGALGEGSSISLEPGGQFELSLDAKYELCDIEKNTKEITTLINRIAKFYNVEFLPYGITPKSTYQNIDIIKKQRYKIMAENLPKLGKFAPVMMRETAGVQLNIDFKDERDAIDKIKLCTYISPILTGFYANSPIRNDKITNYKSYRALAWKYTGPDRCGIFYKNIIDKPKACFEDYINAIIDIPMLFIERDGEKIPINGEITFADFLQRGYMGENATLEDYILHSSLCFPDVRLKKCIEIRNHDCQDLRLTMSICAFYKGILECDYNEVFELFKNINADDINQLGFLAAKYGTDFKYKNIDGAKYAKKLFKIANNNLREDEKSYLDPVWEYLDKNICIADEILNSKITNANSLVEYLRRK